MRKNQFLEIFPSIFERSFSQKLDDSILLRDDALRNLIANNLNDIGYSASPSLSTKIIIFKEDRLLYLLLAKRSASSAPILQYKIDSKFVLMHVFGPVNNDRCLYFELYIDIRNLTKSFSYNKRILNGPFKRASGIALGMHLYEKGLRTLEKDIHLSPRFDYSYLRTCKNQTKSQLRRARILKLVISRLSPLILYSGHDCYASAIDVNAALASSQEFFLLPKNKPNSYYSGGGAVFKRISRGRSKIYFSHLHQYITAMISKQWNRVPRYLLKRAEISIKSRIGDLNSLPYMRIREESFSGYNKFIKAANLRNYDSIELQSNSEICCWIFALHSLSDEAFMWGADRLLSIYNTFLSAAEAIAEINRDDIIIIRPHPNIISHFEGSRESGIYVFDNYLALELCKDIATLGVQTYASPLGPSEEVLGYKNSIVVTHHGNIATEASWLGRPSIFSIVAPYAGIYPDGCQFYDRESLYKAVATTRNLTLKKAFKTPPRKSLIKFQAIIDNPRLTQKQAKQLRIDPTVPPMLVPLNADKFSDLMAPLAWESTAIREIFYSDYYRHEKEFIENNGGGGHEGNASFPIEPLYNVPIYNKFGGGREMFKVNPPTPLGIILQRLRYSLSDPIEIAKFDYIHGIPGSD